uniref:VWFA domain-containing protein n=1 Tax=Panagrolaimus sp. ES5 TaxID=591445 RepID=A0AC34GW92_9BILA
MRLRGFLIFLILWTCGTFEIIEVIEEGSGGEVEIRTNENSFDNVTKADINPSIAAVIDQTPLKVDIVKPIDVAPKIEECLPKLDLIFLLDSSGSIEQIYHEHVRWALALVDTLPIEPDAVHVAAVQYAGFPLTEFSLGTYPKVEEIRQHLQQINFQSGITRTGYALRKAESELFLEDRGARNDATKVIILFTDGLSIDDPLKPAAQLREHKGVKIYVVSVGNDGFKSEMSRIAGEAEHVFGPEDLPQLRNALLNDAEKARACSQIGPTWLKKHKGTTLSPLNLLHKAVLPPLDFLGLLNENEDEEKGGEDEDEEEMETNSNEKGTVSTTNSSLEKDDLTLIPQSQTSTSDKVTVEKSEKETTIVVEPVTSEATVTTFEVTTIAPETLTPSIKKEKTSKASVEVEITATPLTTVTKKIEATTLESVDQVNEPEEKEKTGKKPQDSNSKAFAAQLNSIDESEDIIDVFDIPTEERKKITTLNPITTPKRSTTTRQTTVASTSPATTRAPTTKRIRTTLARRNLATATEKPSESTTVFTRKRPTTTNPATIRIVTNLPRIVTTRRTPAPTRISAFAQRVSFSHNRGPCPMDVLFLVDSSGSVQKNYDTQKQYIKEIISEAELTERTHRVALLQFAGSHIQKTEWAFDAFSTSSELMTALNQVRFITGTTYIGAALDSALQVLENRRPNVPVIIVLVSDGFSQDDATFPAERIRMIPNIQFYSLSVSELTNTNYLAQLVGDPKHVFVSSKATDLKDLLIKKLRCR